MSEMTTTQHSRMLDVLEEVGAERERQHAKWGEQNHPDGTSFDAWALQRDLARHDCEQAAADGQATYVRILREEVLEAFAEEDVERLRAELVQVAAVAVQWIETLDRRAGR